MFKLSNFLLFLLAASTLHAQSVRDHTRRTTDDPARQRYRIGDNTKAAGASVSDTQASDVTLTLNPVSVRPIQTWVRTAGRIDRSGKIIDAIVHPPESTYVKV